mmetsp:Transcript_26312/g.62472  ORF Transcript_26312/g.62472 Transcript_26312/m.62472 type:complete len:208 (+) Transcript_26312:684-1307(+)
MQARGGLRAARHPGPLAAAPAVAGEQPVAGGRLAVPRRPDRGRRAAHRRPALPRHAAGTGRDRCAAGRHPGQQRRPRPRLDRRADPPRRRLRPGGRAAAASGQGRASTVDELDAQRPFEGPDRRDAAGAVVHHRPGGGRGPGPARRAPAPGPQLDAADEVTAGRHARRPQSGPPCSPRSSTSASPPNAASSGAPCSPPCWSSSPGSR